MLSTMTSKEPKVSTYVHIRKELSRALREMAAAENRPLGAQLRQDEQDRAKRNQERPEGGVEEQRHGNAEDDEQNAGIQPTGRTLERATSPPPISASRPMMLAPVEASIRPKTWRTPTMATTAATTARTGSEFMGGSFQPDQRAVAQPMSWRLSM